jgi:hypothetical protein
MPWLTVRWAKGKDDGVHPLMPAGRFCMLRSSHVELRAIRGSLTFWAESVKMVVGR